MNKDMELTGPQQRVFEYVSKHGRLEVELLKARGLDVRAANNLVKAKLMTLTNNVYRLVAQKKEQPVESAPANDVKAKPADAPEAVKKPVVEVADAAKPAKAPKATKAAKPAKAPRQAPPAINPSEKCLCGCGAEIGPKRRFSIGHDAKLHSLVLRVHRGQAKKSELPNSEHTLSYLRSAPWMKDEIAESLGL